MSEQPVVTGRRGFPLPTEAAVVVLAALLAAVSLPLSGRVDATVLPPPPLVAQVAVGVVACGCVPLRHRWPVGLTVALLAASVAFPTAAGVSAVALFAAAARRRPAVALALNGLAVAESVVQSTLYPPRPVGWVTWGLSVGLGAVLATAVTAWGMLVRGRRQLVTSLVERAERAEADQHRRVAEARRRERQRMAAEMHDALAHRLSLLSMHAGALEYRPDVPGDLRELTGVIRASARQAMHDLRDVIGLLRDDDTGEPDGTGDRSGPGLAGLPGLVDESVAAGLRATYDNAVEAPDRLPTALGRTAYRIVREGLTNCRKHAPDGAVSVRLSGTPGGELVAELVNELPERPVPAPLPGSGTGLAGLAERVERGGGTLDHGPTGDGRFRLRARLPWPA